MGDLLKLNFCRIRPVKSPAKANDIDAGIDFFVPDGLDALDYFIDPGKDILIPAGIQVDVPEGWCLTFFNKSGRSTKNKLVVGAQVVDSGYQGEIHLHVFNLGTTGVELRAGEKLVQGLLMPVPKVDLQEVDILELFTEKSNRGDGGFGSTDEYEKLVSGLYNGFKKQ